MSHIALNSAAAAKSIEPEPPTKKISIDDIPREIIGEIIENALLNENSPTGICRVNFNTDVGVWNYGRVCSLWRQETVSRSSLWAYFNVDSELSAIGLSKATAFVKTVLERSGAQDLAITVRLPSGNNDTDNATALFALVLAHSRRWRFMTLVLGCMLVAQLSAVQEKVPRLRRLEFWTEMDFHDLSPIVASAREAAFRLEGPFQDAPELRQIRLFDVPKSLLDRLRVPWCQITEFEEFYTVSRDGSGVGVRHLEQMPTVRRYITRCSAGPLHLPSMPIRHENIQSLAISQGFKFTIGGPPIQYYEMLTLPNLSQITIPSAHHIQPLWRLIERSRCKITTLGLSGLSFSLDPGMPDLRDFCNALTDVTTILIEFIPHRDIFEGIDTAFPRLESVHFTQVAPRDFRRMKDDRMEEFLQRRLGASNVFKEVMLTLEALHHTQYTHWMRYITETSTQWVDNLEHNFALKAKVKIIVD